MQTFKAQLEKLLPRCRIETLNCPEALEIVQKLYGIRLSDVPVTFSKKRLRFWEAGALVIYQTEEGQRLPLLHLKKQDPELIAHELVHFIRRDLDETRFEELFAYRTSKQKWRAFWSPLFRTTSDVWIFFGCLACSIVHPFCNVLPLIWLGFKSLTLKRDHRHLQRAAEYLKQIRPNEDPFHRLIHLTDSQILELSAKKYKPGYQKDLRGQQGIDSD